MTTRLNQGPHARGIQGTTLPGDPMLGKMSKGEVHIIATQENMVADCDASHFRHRLFAFGIPRHLNQGKIGGASAHIDDQGENLSWILREGSCMGAKVVIECRLRLFQQYQVIA